MSLSPLVLSPLTTLYIGDALAVLQALPSTSVDAVVTDPPYAIKRIAATRYDQPAARQPACQTAGCSDADVCVECGRADLIAKYDAAPMLGQQSQNWHAKETHSRGYADSDPKQFQRWCTLWITECLRILKPGGHLVAFGGTRTWHRLATAAEDSGFEIRDSLAWLYSTGMPKSHNVERALAAANNPALAAKWAGWGTALRPSFEPIILARRPLDGTMTQNVAHWNVGPMNLHAVTTAEPDNRPTRWPGNAHLDGATAARLIGPTTQTPERAFWVSKPNKHERVIIDGVAHPTVKPLDLMRRLVRLVTPAGGIVLDPFAGSGTTLEACFMDKMQAVGIEREPDYAALITARIKRHDTDDAPSSAADPTGPHLF